MECCGKPMREEGDNADGSVWWCENCGSLWRSWEDAPQRPRVVAQLQELARVGEKCNPNRKDGG
jgi:hypothetical protein